MYQEGRLKLTNERTDKGDRIVKQDSKLSKIALKQLKDYGVNSEDILLESPIDLSFDSEYISGFIILTERASA